MIRILLVLGVIASFGGPATAQLQPAGPAPARAANWVNVGTASDGSVLWLDSNSIGVDYRTARLRVDVPDGSQVTHFVQFDCDGARFRLIRIEMVDGWPDADQAKQLGLTIAGQIP